ncbi:hypothetical protein N7462_011286 [Penicillium macrosclerotiorum]|uniref:uncharacterized protein n=1 Tax=Penicillium macrosclerotiorum TaxID=303699 RepID=UPI002547EA85|nr:uncharacterized protein N7462_011286 [Penicillium macrosclerotiorum]KAJ5666877.1 hypothetical protein N7462_011286 [Penicillium macrosclerotiorum]
MDTTFITIHDLSHDASIRYASDSIKVVLGYQPHEVLNRSCWDYFHPQELHFARSVHGRGVRLDKAAVLNYCSIRHKNGSWIGCECVFTVVYDVLIASTTVYGRGRGSQKRAVDAPIVRQLFDSSPNDPRYHMLTFISEKFSRRLAQPLHEPRAALFVNRFTRTATIMYATNGVTEILGLSPQQLISQSFFYCIQDRCLRDAVRCLESAKANDSIAYLRFWFRNPLQGDGAGVDGYDGSSSAEPFGSTAFPLELEAVVSCTSDGLVIILRHARPPIPNSNLPPKPVPIYSNGLFAAPWALQPVLAYGTPSYPQDHQGPNPTYPEIKTTLCKENEGPAPASVASRNPPGSSSAFDFTRPPFYTDTKGVEPNGPLAELLMDTIRDVAVFAWGIIGINRSLEQYKCGTPSGNAQPQSADAMVDDMAQPGRSEPAAGRAWQ